MRGTDPVIECVMHPLTVGGLAMGKGILAGLIQCVPIGQLGLPEGSQLLRGRDQFQFGSDRRLHRNICCCNRRESERRRCFLPRLKTVGIRTAHLMKDAQRLPRGMLATSGHLILSLGSGNLEVLCFLPNLLGQRSWNMLPCGSNGEPHSRLKPGVWLRGQRCEHE